MRSILFGSLALLSVILFAAQSSQSPPRSDFSHGPHGYGRRPTNGATSSGDAECSRIGLDMLGLGGTAADAAVAIQFCLGVKVPDLTGIGGGGFALVRAPNGSFVVVDFRETAPAASAEDMYQDKEEESLVGGLAVATPGEIRGLQYLHQHFGKLPWKRLLQPSVDIARKGFVMGEYFESALAYLESQDFLVQDPEWAADFAPNGTVVSKGDTIRRLRLAQTLEAIAAKGPDAFYTGPVAAAVVKRVQEEGGILTLQDLAEYQVVVRQPAEIRYRDYRILGTGIPSGAPVALNVMKVIEGYGDFGLLSNPNLSTHRLDEAFRFGYGLRTEMGDPGFVADMEEYQAKILDGETAAAIRGRISDEHTLPVKAYNPKNLEILPTPGTSHLVAADKQGMVISLTSTINTAFGSRVMVPGTGIILNNEMNDFSIPGTTNFFGFEPSPNNFILPGKRPQSSMSPIIAQLAECAGHSFIALGGIGGSRIITAVSQVLSSILDEAKGCAEALDVPRFHDQLQPDEIFFEWEFDNSTVGSMEARGHNVTWMPRRSLSAVMVIQRREDRIFEAAADPTFKGSAGLVF